MKQVIKGYVDKIMERVTNRLIKKTLENGSLASNISYKVALETVWPAATDKKPNEIFRGVSDDFWFWLNTEGVRRNAPLRNMLPGTPDAYTQEMFTGDKGDSTLSEAFYYYKVFKEQYNKYRGDLSDAHSILDFGCGWGRFIRFFLKDAEASKIWGCDPVPEMIELNKKQNKWCNFQLIDASPPTPFQDNTFDLIYSFSVFSHLSEERHLSILAEINRILRPGGLYITTTRNRRFINFCAEMKKRSDLSNMNEGPRSSSNAFADTQQSLSIFDQGLYCHYSFNDPKWPYWGETAIPKKYVLDHWTQSFTFLDFLDIDTQYQNVIVVQKPFGQV